MKPCNNNTRVVARQIVPTEVVYVTCSLHANINGPILTLQAYYSDSVGLLSWICRPTILKAYYPGSVSLLSWLCRRTIRTL